jgi:hypothetical protein
VAQRRGGTLTESGVCLPGPVGKSIHVNLTASSAVSSVNGVRMHLPEFDTTRIYLAVFFFVLALVASTPYVFNTVFPVLCSLLWAFLKSCRGTAPVWPLMTDWHGVSRSEISHVREWAKWADVPHTLQRVLNITVNTF